MDDVSSETIDLVKAFNKGVVLTKKEDDDDSNYREQQRRNIYGFCHLKFLSRS